MKTRWEARAAAGFMDTRLGYISLFVEVYGAEIHQGGVPARGIIEAFDIIEHVLPCLIARAVGFARGSLSLQRGEEAHHRGLSGILCARP